MSNIAGAGIVFTSGALAGKTTTLGVFNANDINVLAITGDSIEALIVFKDTGVSGDLAADRVVRHPDVHADRVAATSSGTRAASSRSRRKAMASVKTGYGSQGVAITITLTSLADSSTAGRESAVVSNTSDAWLDVLIQGKLVGAAPARSRTVGGVRLRVRLARTAARSTPTR